MDKPLGSTPSVGHQIDLSFLPQCRALVVKYSDETRSLQEVLDRVCGGINGTSNSNWTPGARHGLLDVLAHLLVSQDARVHSLPLSICQVFRVILPDLLMRATCEHNNNHNTFSLERHERCGALFQALLPHAPHLFGVVLGYYTSGTRAPPFERLIIKPSLEDTALIEGVLQTTYVLLQHDTSAFQNLWDWSSVYGCLSSTNVLVRWYALECITKLIGASDYRRHQLHLKYNTASIDTSVLWSTEQEKCAEQEAIAIAKPNIVGRAANGENTLLKNSRNSEPSFEVSDLRYCKDVCGVLVVVSAQDASAFAQESGKNTTKGVSLREISSNGGGDNGLAVATTDSDASALVQVPSTQKNLRRIALAMTMKQPILLTGPVGCGKTAAVEHLSQTLVRLCLRCIRCISSHTAALTCDSVIARLVVSFELTCLRS